MDNNKKIKVIKFGGDCISQKDKLFTSVKIIMSEKYFPIVVVVAFEGITDLLIEGIKKAKGEEKNVSNVISVLTEKHYDIAQETIKNDKIFNRVIKDITLQIKKAERLLYGVAYTEEITDSTYSYILSYGERLAATIFCGVLEDNGCKTKLIETDKIGMVTDDNYENAIINLSEFKKNFNFLSHNIINSGIMPVFTGFFGCNTDGKIVTFGRHGGDYSASVIAYAFNADELEIWKCKDGFTSADTDLVKKAHIIPVLSYFEAAELIYFGKKILHPLTIEPVTKDRIPIVIKNINSPEHTGTKIVPDSYSADNVIKSVSQNEEISMIRIHGTGIGYKPGLIRKFSNALYSENINIFATLSSQTTINILIENKDAEAAYNILNEYNGKIIEKIEYIKNIALVAVVGEGLIKKRGIFARILNCVSNAKVNVEMASAGASDVAIYIIVPKDELKDVINAIHTEFFSE